MRRLRRQRGVPIRSIEDKDSLPHYYSARGDKAQMLTRRVRPRWFAVERLMVDFPLRRRGLMTRMYEVAAQDACDSGAVLVSDTERSAFAEAFWRKQKRKGRARCLVSNRNDSPNAWDGPVLNLEEHLAQKYRDRRYGTPNYDRAAREMKKLNLPKPRRGANGKKWSCLRWGFKRKMCKSPRPFDLSGL